MSQDIKSIYSRAVFSGKDISVAIPCFNGEKYIGQLLDSLCQQNEKPGEIIVVDDGSVDRGLTIAQAYPGVTCLSHETNKGLAKTRNTLVEHSRGPVIAFLDVDTKVPPDFIEKMATLYRLYPSAAGVGGRAIERSITSIYDKYRQNCMSQGFGYSIYWPAPMLWGVCSSYHKDIIERLGRFDHRFRTNGEDVEFGLRCKKSNYKLLYHPSLKVSHMKGDSHESIRRASYRWIYWGVKALMKHRQGVIPGLLKRFSLETIQIMKETDSTYRNLKWELLRIKVRAMNDALLRRFQHARM